MLFIVSTIGIQLWQILVHSLARYHCGVSCSASMREAEPLHACPAGTVRGILCSENKLQLPFVWLFAYKTSGTAH